MLFFVLDTDKDEDPNDDGDVDLDSDIASQDMISQAEYSGRLRIL
jgi:hypothetical protein